MTVYLNLLSLMIAMDMNPIFKKLLNCVCMCMHVHVNVSQVL